MPGFVLAVIVPDIMPTPASVAQTISPIVMPPTVPALPRIEIALKNGQRTSVEGTLDIDLILKLARGLEALR